MAIYGFSVAAGITGGTIEGQRGCANSVERVAIGTYAVKLDASLAAREFSVTVKPHKSALAGVWNGAAWKRIDPPGKPPGTYVYGFVYYNNGLTDQDFDVLINTFVP